MAEEDIIAQAATAMTQAAQTHPAIAGQGSPTGQPSGPTFMFGQTPPSMPSLPPTLQSSGQTVHARPTGGFGTVGERKRADRQALMDNTVNLIKSGSDYLVQKKQRALQMDIGNILSAFQGVNEAKAILQDPNSTPQQKQEAMQGLQKNTQLINDTVSDPKKNKMLQKAFDIDIFGNKGKNKMENQALYKAFEEFHKKQTAGDKTALNPIAQMIANKQPFRQQMNPLYTSQAQAIKDKLMPDANTVANIQNEAQQRMFEAAKAKYQGEVQLEHARIIGGQMSGGGTLVYDPNSQTGLSMRKYSKDGKTTQLVMDAVAPGILPSVTEGSTALTVEDRPGHSVVAIVPHTTTRRKGLPDGRLIGANGLPQDPTKGGTTNRIPGSTPEGDAKAKAMGLPEGSTIIAGKAMTPAMVLKLQDNINSLEGTIKVMDKLYQYADIYAGMMGGGKVKLATNPRSGVRYIAQWLPTTDEEKQAVAAWQESAEYMNKFRQMLAAQGFRSIPAYDNMLALRGQIWQDPDVMRYTIKDGIELLEKSKKSNEQLLGESKQEDKKEIDPNNPKDLAF